MLEKEELEEADEEIKEKDAQEALKRKKKYAKNYPYPEQT
jgi:hypothetical protein